MSVNPDTLAISLDTYLTRIAPFGFSGAALLAHQDKVLLEKGYGLADRENNMPVTADTLFSMGSITKSMTATAVMKLYQMGKLDLHAPIGDLLEGVPDDKAAITIHQLLTHTAGFINYTGDDYELAGKDQFLSRLYHAPLLFEPGSQYDYSNAGYSLLAAIVEQISGQEYEQFLYDQVFKPAEMEETGYVRPDWLGKSIARWYTGSRDNGHPLEKPYPYWNLLGNGGMLSILGDMYRWHQALLRDDLLDGVTKALMYTPLQRNYACGWRVDETEIGRLVHHNGASDLGSSAIFRRYLDAELVLVMFFNQSYGDVPMMQPLQVKIDQLIAGEAIQLPPQNIPIVAPAELRVYEGTYLLPAGGQITASTAGQTLLLTADGQPAINMLAFPGSSATTHQQLNQLHQDIFMRFFAGELEPLQDFLANPDQRLDRIIRMLATNLEEAEEFFGDFQGLQVAGTVPSSFVDGAVDTLVALQFERGETAILSISRDGKNIGMTMLELTQGWSLPSVPLGSGLLGYHIPLGLVIELELEKDEHGRVMVLQTQSGERAARMGMPVDKIR